MKIAQIVVTRAYSGGWKLLVMSRKQTEERVIYETLSRALEDLELRMAAGEWEEPSS